jgi:hypothetical protein
MSFDKVNQNFLEQNCRLLEPTFKKLGFSKRQEKIHYIPIE